MAGLRLRINIGNGCKAWSSSLAAWRSVVSIHGDRQGETPRSASRRSAPAGIRPRPAAQRAASRRSPSAGSTRGRPASRVRGYSRSSLIDKGDADDRLHVAGSDLACGPGIGCRQTEINWRGTDGAQRDRAVRRHGAAVAGQLNAYPLRRRGGAVLVKIALALSAVVPER